jgi:hypothetical protein
LTSFLPYPEMSWEDYCKKIENGELPGDGLCLIALSNEFQFSFTLFTSDIGLAFLVDYHPKITQFPTAGPSSSSYNLQSTEDESPSRALRKSPTITLKSLLLSQRQAQLYDSLGPVIEGILLLLNL